VVDVATLASSRSSRVGSPSPSRGAARSTTRAATEATPARAGARVTESVAPQPREARSRELEAVARPATASLVVVRPARCPATLGSPGARAAVARSVPRGRVEVGRASAAGARAAEEAVAPARAAHRARADAAGAVAEGRVARAALGESTSRPWTACLPAELARCAFMPAAKRAGRSGRPARTVGSSASGTPTGSASLPLPARLPYPSASTFPKRAPPTISIPPLTVAACQAAFVRATVDAWRMTATLE